MPITNFTLFLSITFIVSASPGPVMLSCMANGGRLGMRKAFLGMLGACSGNLVLVGLSALGLGLIISQNDTLFNIVKWAGAAYLAFLGLQIMRKPIKGDQLNTGEITSSKSVLLNSFLVAIGNPKGLIYFGALFPQFISYQEPIGPQFLILTVTFLTMDLMWMFAYAVAGNKIMRWLKSPKHQIWFNTLSGLVLIIAAIFMALSGKA
ncbi:MAG: LysE family translocator [Gammaproteobacteria bacterium]|nr:MAG: LysE family translocator [Gammaproteobacteria bacterium]